MEIYRALYGPFPNCKSYPYLIEIYRLALPPLSRSISECSIDVLQKRDSKLFFPREEIQKLFTRPNIEEILKCDCDSCLRGRESSLPDFKRLVDWVEDNAKILLSIMIYLGHTWMIKSLGTRPDTIRDENLDAVLTHVGAGRRPVGSSPGVGLNPGFKSSYQRALALFRPRVFVIGRPSLVCDDHERFPYIIDEYHAKGSFGEVRKIQIHPDYIDDTVKRKYPNSSVKLPNGTTVSQCYFARKVIRKGVGGIVDEDLQMEKEVLNEISKQEHPHLVDLIAFYSWRGEVNFIFPFVEYNLHTVLHSEWRPERFAAQPGQFPHHWLWQQMLNVADALRAIHNPEVQSYPDRGRIIGFHFDLKPANILVTPEGVLQITDFGQSMIKLIEDDDENYGEYVGGDPGYQPPEACPSREEVIRTVLPHEYENLPQPLSPTSSHALPVPSTPGSRRSSSAVSNRHLSAPSVSESSAISNAPSSMTSESSTVMATSNYDVFSLACIMLEVLVYIFNDGSDGVLDFEDERRQAKRGLCFHDGKHLHQCVIDMMSNLHGQDIPVSLRQAQMMQRRSYLDDTLDFLAKMFDSDPKQRPSSAKVVAEFERIGQKHKRINDPELELIQYLLNDPIQGDGYNEILFSFEDGEEPFYRMPKVKYEIVVGSGRSKVDCRIQLLCKRTAIMIKVCYRDPSGSLRCDRYVFYYRNSYYSPIYLYKTDGRTACGVYNNDNRLILHFDSQGDLLTFQSVATRYRPARGLRLEEVFVEPVSGPDARYPNLNGSDDWPWCQIWAACQPHDVCKHSPDDIKNNRPNAAGHVMILFCGPGKGFLVVPLRDGKKAVKEVQVQLPEESTTIIIKHTDSWNKWFNITKPNTTRMLPFDAPAMPLDTTHYEAYQDDDRNNKLRQARKVEVTFRDHSVLVKFRKIIATVNVNNENSSNHINWDSGTAVRGPRRESRAATLQPPPAKIPVRPPGSHNGSTGSRQDSGSSSRLNLFRRAQTNRDS